MKHLQKISDKYRRFTLLNPDSPMIVLTEHGKIDYRGSDTPLIYTVNIPSGGKTINILPPEMGETYDNVVTYLKSFGTMGYQYTVEANYNKCSQRIANGNWILQDVQPFFNMDNWEPSWTMDTSVEGHMDSTTFKSTIATALSTSEGRARYLVQSGMYKTGIDWIVNYYNNDYNKLVQYLTEPTKAMHAEVYMLKEILIFCINECDNEHKPTSTYLYYPAFDGNNAVDEPKMGVGSSGSSDSNPNILSYEKVNVSDLAKFFKYSSNAYDNYAQFMVISYARYAHNVSKLTLTELLDKTYDEIWDMGADMYMTMSDTYAANIVEDKNSDEDLITRTGRSNKSIIRTVYIDDIKQETITNEVNLSAGEHTIKIEFDGKLQTIYESAKTDYLNKPLILSSISSLTLDETTTSVILPKSVKYIPIMALPNLATIYGKDIKGFIYLYNADDYLSVASNWNGINSNVRVICENPHFKQDGGIFIIDNKQIMSVENSIRFSTQANIYDPNDAQFPNISGSSTITNFTFPNNSIISCCKDDVVEANHYDQISFADTLDLGEGMKIINKKYNDSHIGNWIFRNTDSTTLNTLILRDKDAIDSFIYNYTSDYNAATHIKLPANLFDYASSMFPSEWINNFEAL